MKLIGLTAKARCGKNTVAAILRLSSSWRTSKYFKIRYPNEKDFICSALKLHSEAAYGASQYTEVAFADILKTCVCFIFGIDDFSKMNDEIFKNSPNSLNLTNSNGEVYTYRELLQKIGTEVGRVVDPNLWVKSMFSYLKEDQNYIITDIRFKNELEYCKEKGAVIIKINRNVPEMPHSSEHDLDDETNFDIVIDNNGTIEELVDKVLQLNLV